jgi:hypothetical protein
MDESTQSLAHVLAEGAAEMVAEVKQQATAGKLTPEKVNALKVSDATLRKLAQRVEAQLMKAHAMGGASAVRELRTARDEQEDGGT